MKKTIKLRDPSTYSESSYASSWIFPNHITYKEEATGITIAEIDSSSSSESGYEVEKCERKHAWCYVDNNEKHMNDEIYNVNKNASEKRRMKNKVCPEFINRDIEYVRYKNNEANNESNSEHIYTGFYNHKWCSAKEDTSTKNPLNCFTIISNELADSESSSDKENGVEKIQCGDVVLESDYWNNNDDDNNNSKFKSYHKDLDNSKRTIWIYSFKNKNMLNEDITHINISSTDSNSSTSVDYEDLETVENRSKTKYQYRVASPTPATFVPRLNFYVAATLPTVTEITEPYQYTTGNETISLKSENFPLEENNTKTKNSNNLKEDFKESTISATNVINWLALSPRTKRRNLKLPKLIDKNYFIGEEIKNDEKCKLKCNGLWNTLKNNETTFASTSDQKSDNNSVITYVETKKDEQTYTKAISTEQEKDESLIDEKGDYNKIKRLKKPHIRINQLIKKELTTDPIENLNGDCWIGDKNEHGNKGNFYIAEIDSVVDNEKPEEILRCARDRLFSKNMHLLKPVEWSEFLPITESVPSLHLSLPSDINEDKQSWFTRIIKCICCIKCK